MDLDKILPKEGPSKNEVKKYLQKYLDEIIVIKFGGSVLEDKDLFEVLIRDISILKKLNFKIVIIHGGGKNISLRLKSVNIESKFIDGSRVTTKKMIEIIEEVLIELNLKIANLINTSLFNAEALNTKKNNIITVIQENKELGFVGKPIDIKTNILKNLIIKGTIPVIAPLGLDDKNSVFNINADTVAGFIAQKLNARRLIIISDVKGVLDENSNLVSEINSVQAGEMIKKKIISGGMIPKIKNCLDVARKGVKGVVIIDGRQKHSILYELLSDKGSGTLIRK